MYPEAIDVINMTAIIMNNRISGVSIAIIFRGMHISVHVSYMYACM